MNYFGPLNTIHHCSKTFRAFSVASIFFLPIPEIQIQTLPEVSINQEVQYGEANRVEIYRLTFHSKYA